MTRMDAMSVGLAAWRLGAGRARKQDAVQAGAGVRMHAKPGDRITEGQPLFTLLTDDEHRIARAQQALEGAVDVDAEGGPYETPELVFDRISASDLTD